MQIEGNSLNDCFVNADTRRLNYGEIAKIVSFIVIEHIIGGGIDSEYFYSHSSRRPRIDVAKGNNRMGRLTTKGMSSKISAVANDSRQGTEIEMGCAEPSNT